jgi:hypothetical protein
VKWKYTLLKSNPLILKLGIIADINPKLGFMKMKKHDSGAPILKAPPRTASAYVSKSPSHGNLFVFFFVAPEHESLFLRRMTLCGK